MTNAVVVGSGPNGLAAALTLASAGASVVVLEAGETIGGGTHTVEAIVHGLLHDSCSAIHPMAVGSPFLNGLGLDAYGLKWRRAEVDCAHPLDDGSAGVLYRSIEKTVAALGDDGPQWRWLFERNVERYDTLCDDILHPLLHFPRHPTKLARFGLPTLPPAILLAHVFSTPQAKALFGGVAAHAFQPLHRPLTSAIGLGILTAGHHDGWAVAEGGSQAITTALAAKLSDLGGSIETGVHVRSARQLPPADVTMFDLAPQAVAAILGDRLPARVSRAFKRFRFGPAAFKVDFAVEDGVPWTNRDARRAGTVHLGGSFPEIVASERAIHAGRLPERPFVLVGQQYLADPVRSAGNIHPVYSYAHVPNGFDGDATSAIIDQFERFAPGFRDRVIGHTTFTPAAFASYNANFVGGDINTGAKDIRQLVFGPRATLSPYSIGVPGMYICSAATPPGPGAHGMCGHNAARQAISYLQKTSKSRRVSP